MLVFVDYEHASGYEREHGERMLAARARITYRLEDLSGSPCHLVRYDRIDQQLLDQLGATAIFISGNSVAPADYDPASLEPVIDIIQTTTLPIFGFCGGFQLIARALDTDVVPLPVTDEVRADPTVVISDKGTGFEYGYHPVAIDEPDHPLLSGIDDPVFRHAHGFNVAEPPSGFVNLARTAATPVQLAVHHDRKIIGTQFHPEYWTNEAPSGQTLISNFLTWAVTSE